MLVQVAGTRDSVAIAQPERERFFHTRDDSLLVAPADRAGHDHRIGVVTMSALNPLMSAGEIHAIG